MVTDKDTFKDIKDNYLDDLSWEEIALILKDALWALEEEGWIKGSFYQASVTGDGYQYCAVGSLMRAVAARTLDVEGEINSTHLDQARNNSAVNGLTEMLDHLARDRYLLRHFDGIVSMNDSGSTTIEDVTGTFRAALDVVMEMAWEE